MSSLSAIARIDSFIEHGSATLPGVVIDDYSAVLVRNGKLVGDGASRSAFDDMLQSWRMRFLEHQHKDPFDQLPDGPLATRQLDHLYSRGGAAADTIETASEDYARTLARVVMEFRALDTWRGVDRIIVGGGFRSSRVGQHAIERARQLIHQEAAANELPDLEVRLLHHDSDDAGLLGWVHMLPREALAGEQGFLAVDIGGTHVRCGVVMLGRSGAANASRATVWRRSKWCHADQDVSRDGLVEKLSHMLQAEMACCDRHQFQLAPFIGISCPGVIRKDGLIDRGAQNLPGNWEHGFDLPQALRERIPHIGGGTTRVLMHNDAVVQGLSELPYTRDVARWAVLTVGTGLGNASFTNC